MTETPLANAVEQACMTLRPERGESPELDIAFVSEPGSSGRNEDYVGVMLGDLMQRSARGSVVALADGMSGGRGGRVAAELAVRSFIDGYYAPPHTLAPEAAASRALDAIHRWLHQIGRSDAALNQMAACFAALVIRGATAWLVGAGDVRLYQLRDGEVSQLGGDDVIDVPFGAFVAHAIGMQSALVTRIESWALKEGDRLLLCSDGLYRRIPWRELRAVLSTQAPAAAVAERLVQMARSRGSTDDVSAVVVDVRKVPDLDYRYLEGVLGDLPILAVPACGEVIDGYALSTVLSDGHYSRIFIGHDLAAPQKRLALKFPKPRVDEDANVRQSIVRERWLAGKIDSENVLAPSAIDPARQTRLYVVMPFLDGLPLETLMTPALMSLTRGLAIARQLGRAIHGLNRQGIFHRDIKPENVLVLPDDSVRLLDLGFAYMPGLLAPGPSTAPGTPAYMAPELIKGAEGDARSEVFAFGVTLYRMFSGGRSPYGFNSRVPLQHHRPDLPVWLDLVLEKAMQADPERRYQDALEVCAELDRFAAGGGETATAARLPLIERSPVTFWKSVALILLILLLIALAHGSGGT
ncbi:bifunctional protein-serine/threonine kinase/phosphatase [Paraburkholderia youngii]|uniref:Serine/threonine protein phosphatase PrpC/tRNA A-37 threonylcarbamoyl transferase component Bud32 n=1 Tax=Paraburkholderia youngii TaxID=2782701 RepID=A0A7W8NYN6_9BURK|nr:bifunctional protein-serine/threonine kinase/phosphatase [Paraburkholderia youngii]MBB5398069.1 serine/threonine protein phosphatase PrpC/tRNA A-37 threonylcarbamoyl transferase component Bud32 [Paraburkholderia youngii]